MMNQVKKVNAIMAIDNKDLVEKPDSNIKTRKIEKKYS